MDDRQQFGKMTEGTTERYEYVKHVVVDCNKTYVMLMLLMLYYADISSFVCLLHVVVAGQVAG